MTHRFLVVPRLSSAEVLAARCRTTLLPLPLPLPLLVLVLVLVLLVLLFQQRF
jgi:hypothetical protein